MVHSAGQLSFMCLVSTHVMEITSKQEDICKTFAQPTCKAVY